MLESSFSILRQIGILAVNEQEQIHFSIDAYHGFRYLTVRRYLEQEEGFSGPTRDGVTLTPEIVRTLVPLLLALPQDYKQLKLGPVGKFAKRPGVCVVVAVSEFRGERGLEMRLWSQEKGFSKNGVWLPLVHWMQIRQLFADALAAFNEVPEIDF